VWVIKSKNEVGWHVAGMGKSRGAYRVLVAKLEGKKATSKNQA